MEPLIAELIRAEVKRCRERADRLDAFLQVKPPIPAAAPSAVAIVTSSSSSFAGRRRGTMSPETLRLRKQQGSYMGFVRRLGAREKARVSKIREKYGYIRAIALAKRLAR